MGLAAAIKRIFGLQLAASHREDRLVEHPGCTSLRNLLNHVPKAGQDMVAAAMKAVLVIQAPDQVRKHWQRVTELLRKHFPRALPGLEAARENILAFLHFQQEHSLALDLEQGSAGTPEQGD